MTSGAGTNLLRLLDTEALMTASPVDQREPSGAHLLLINSVLSQAGLVNKKAGELNLGGDAFLFADDHAKLWPLSTREEFLKSAASIEIQRDVIAPQRFSRLQEALDKAASLHEARYDWEQVRAAVAGAAGEGSEKRASAGFAVPAMSLYSLDNPERAVEQFLADRARLPYRMRKTAATALLSTGAAVDPETRDTLERIAGLAVPDTDKMARMLADTADLIARNHPREAVELFKAASHVARVTSHEEALGLLEPVVEALDVWNTSGTPEEDLCPFGNTKAAAVANSFVDLGGLYPKAALATIPADVVPTAEDVADADGLIDPEKLEAAFASRKVASDVFERVMQGFGLRATGAKPDRRQPDVTDEELRLWEHKAAEIGVPVTREGLETSFSVPLPAATVGKDLQTPTPPR